MYMRWKINKKIGIVIVLVVCLVIACGVLNEITDGAVFNVKNLKNVLAGSVVPTIVAYGFAIVFAGNVTDLSPGSVVILVAMVTGLVGNAFGVVAMVVAGVLTGAACMALNYSIYRVTRIPPWIAGLGMTMLYEGITLWYANFCASRGMKTVALEMDLRIFGSSPGIYLCWILAIVAAYLLYNHTSIGINYRAAGENEDVVKSMGIKVDKAMLLGGIAAGAFFGFAGVVKECYAGYVNALSGLATLGTTFQPMAATLLAMALSNYINLMLAIPVATCLITLVFNVLTILGVPSGTFQDTILGCIVIVVAILAQRKKEGGTVK